MTVICYMGQYHRFFYFFFSNVNALKLFLSCTEHIVNIDLHAVYIYKKGAYKCYAKLLIKALLRTWWLKLGKASREILSGL